MRFKSISYSNLAILLELKLQTHILSFNSLIDLPGRISNSVNQRNI